MPVKGRFKSIRDSRIVKDFLVFLIFMVISTMFWLILSLNDDTIQEFRVPVQIGEVPDSLEFATEPPSVVEVKVKDRGLNLFKYSVVGSPELKLSYAEFARDKRLRVSNENLLSSLDKLFGVSSTVISVNPDSLSLRLKIKKEEGEQ